jgi:hypothetical protein
MGMRYAWEIPYFLAILQTDEASGTRAVYEAIEAMEQRRLTPVNGAEEVALMSAEGEMQMLVPKIRQKSRPIAKLSY